MFLDFFYLDFCCLWVIIIAIINILIASWMYTNSVKKGKNGYAWFGAGIFLGPIGLILWLLARPPDYYVPYSYYIPLPPMQEQKVSNYIPEFENIAHSTNDKNLGRASMPEINPTTPEKNNQKGDKAYYLLKEGNRYELSITPTALLYKDLLTGYIDNIPYETVRDIKIKKAGIKDIGLTGLTYRNLVAIAGLFLVGFSLGISFISILNIFYLSKHIFVFVSLIAAALIVGLIGVLISLDSSILEIKGKKNIYISISNKNRDAVENMINFIRNRETIDPRQKRQMITIDERNNAISFLRKKEPKTEKAPTRERINIEQGEAIRFEIPGYDNKLLLTDRRVIYQTVDKTYSSPYEQIQDISLKKLDEVVLFFALFILGIVILTGIIFPPLIIANLIIFTVLLIPAFRRHKVAKRPIFFILAKANNMYKYKASLLLIILSISLLIYAGIVSTYFQFTMAPTSTPFGDVGGLLWGVSVSLLTGAGWFGALALYYTLECFSRGEYAIVQITDASNKNLKLVFAKKDRYELLDAVKYANIMKQYRFFESINNRVDPNNRFY